ncbi:peptidase inhibitor family I36 protein [[Kitasatospora] papulosa]|uniref:peptidase inhibitor family I36 protein n=2 Tax=Streptomyces TaxID=1883 RepID=UPI000996B2AE|nr:peptidase inhibitor family I36 protein [Streptomyces sp. NRRL S-325]
MDRHKSGCASRWRLLGKRRSMDRLRKFILSASALALTVGGSMASSTAAHAASTDGSCPSGNLCLWEYPNFTGARVITASTNACVPVKYVNQFAQSYKSHLPVTAVLRYDDDPPVRTLPAGGFSSAFPVVMFNFICTNGKTP